MTKKPLINDPAKFRKKIEKLSSLPTLPHLMLRFSQMAEDPETSMETFGKEISRDQVLTSKILQLVNSAFYGFPGRISTLTQALVLLGLDAVKGLIITSSVFDGLTPEAYPLWRHSLLVSLAARMLARSADLPDIEEIAVAGLLHDIGKVILFIEAPDEYRQVINYTENDNRPLFQIESELLGFNHSEIGCWVSKQWRLPDKLIEPITFHHGFNSSCAYPENVKIVFLADTIVKALGGASSSDELVYSLPEGLVDEFAINEEDFSDIAEKILTEIENLEGIGPEDLK